MKYIRNVQQVIWTSELWFIKPLSYQNWWLFLILILKSKNDDPRMKKFRKQWENLERKFASFT